ncbi:MAG: hypothetical protein NPIRA03_05790 [Nitrospirales bacterium]|nr:MAG: hypothetical protein NPIRA03_05790 [Nitrospirales bacterium]
MPHEFFRTARFHDFSVDAAVPATENPENDTIARRGSAQFAFPPTTNVGLIQLNHSLEFHSFQLSQMV